MRSPVPILAMILVLTAPQAARAGDGTAAIRMVRCGKGDCMKALRMTIQEASAPPLYSVPGVTPPLLSRKGRRVDRFRNLFALASGETALLGCWRPSSTRAAGEMAVLRGAPARAVLAKLRTGRATPAPGVWFPETGAARAWRRLSLPRRRLKLYRAAVSAMTARRLAEIAERGVAVEVETSRGAPGETTRFLRNAGVRVTVAKLPASRYRRCLAEIDGRKVLGLPGEGMVLAGGGDGGRDRASEPVVKQGISGIREVIREWTGVLRRSFLPR